MEEKNPIHVHFVMLHLLCRIAEHYIVELLTQIIFESKSLSVVDGQKISRVTWWIVLPLLTKLLIKFDFAKSQVRTTTILLCYPDSFFLVWIITSNTSFLNWYCKNVVNLFFFCSFSVFAYQTHLKNKKRENADFCQDLDWKDHHSGGIYWLLC